MYKGYELLKRIIEKKDIHTQKNKEIMRIQEALEAISEGALDTTLNVNEFHGQQKKGGGGCQPYTPGSYELGK